MSRQGWQRTLVFGWQGSPKMLGPVIDVDQPEPKAWHVCSWLKADIQSAEIEVCLYEAFAVKVVLVCVA
jgi:hypothetical protein